MRYWVDGEVVEAEQARVSVLDHGLTVGDGVFETMKVVDGLPFALSRHLDRLARSARGLGLEAPPDAYLRDALGATLAANAEDPECVAAAALRLRVTVTGGPGPLGSARGNAGPTTIVSLAAASTWPETAGVAVVPWVRNERSPTAGIKTTSYAENVVALAHATSRGAGEALLANSVGMLCEGTGSNVFVVLDGVAVTPPLTSGALAGVTRALVLEWTGAQERDVPMALLDSAEEMFLTSSTRDVQGVHAVDERRLSAPGPLTRAAAETFRQRAAADLDP